MLKNITWLYLFSFPFFLYAQTDSGYKGIRFEQNLNWAQIKEIAKVKNKYIFVDCFTTWCGPCKFMDSKIYTDKGLGSYFNSKFISIKIQLDTSEKDNEHIIKFRNEASIIRHKYNVNDFPTYLFFSPNGEIVHRSSGIKSARELMSIAEDAMIESRQYYTMIKNYKNGGRDYLRMPYVTNMAKSLGESELAIKIANDYIDNYLMKINGEGLFTKKNIEFIGSHIESTYSPAFRIFIDSSKRIDNLIRPNYSRDVVDYVLTKEYITPFIRNVENENSFEPNWKKIKNTIKRRCNKDHADRTVLNGQLRWYRMKKNWKMLVTCNVKKIEKYGLDTVGLAAVLNNNMIWDVIFLHCNDKKILKKAVGWQKLIIDSHPSQDNIDTYANLLYKIGVRNDAILWEKVAIEKESQDAIKYKREQNNVFKETLDKMEAGVPTWIMPEENKD